MEESLTVDEGVHVEVAERATYIFLKYYIYLNMGYIFTKKSHILHYILLYGYPLVFTFSVQLFLEDKTAIPIYSDYYIHRVNSNFT